MKKPHLCVPAVLGKRGRRPKYVSPDEATERDLKRRRQDVEQNAGTGGGDGGAGGGGPRRRGRPKGSKNKPRTEDGGTDLRSSLVQMNNELSSIVEEAAHNHNHNLNHNQEQQKSNEPQKHDTSADNMRALAQMFGAHNALSKIGKASFTSTKKEPCCLFARLNVPTSDDPNKQYFCFDVNEAFCEMLGREREELMCKYFDDILHLRGVSISSSDVSPAQQTPFNLKRIQQCYLHKNHRKVKSMDHQSLFYSNGTLQFIFIMSDYKKRKK
jgi:hypothetical protein